MLLLMAHRRTYDVRRFSVNPNPPGQNQLANRMALSCTGTLAQDTAQLLQPEVMIGQLWGAQPGLPYGGWMLEAKANAGLIQVDGAR